MIEYGFVSANPDRWFPLPVAFAQGGQKVVEEADGIVWIRLHPEAEGIDEETWVRMLERHYECVFDGTREV